MNEAKALCERCGAPLGDGLAADPSGAAACPACGGATRATGPAAAQAATPAPLGPEAATRTGNVASTPTPASPLAVPSPEEPGPGADDQAWAAVVACWEDDEAHRAFLTRFADLDGLAGAGRRYREVLSRRPEDPVALRWRDEIVSRAMAQGLAGLPRLDLPRASPRLLRWAALAGMIAAVAVAVVWMAWRLLGLARS